MDDHTKHMLEQGYLAPAQLKLKNSSWFHLMFKNAKSHSVPLHLVRRLIIDIEAQGSLLEWWKPSRIAVLDSGGMCWQGESEHTIQMGLLTIKTRVSDVSHFASEIRRLPLRYFTDGTPYYKMHSRYQCLVMKPGFKVKLERQLISATDSCEEQADAGIKELRRRIDAVEKATPFVRCAPRGRQ